MTTPSRTEPTLRERKKLTAMRRIQAVAMDLMERHGYSAVTVENIASAAEVSPSSVYRYFTTKEGIVLWEEGVDDSVLVELGTRARSAPPIVAARAALLALAGTEYEQDQQRIMRQFDLAFNVPEIAEAMRAQLEELRRAMVGLLADSLDRPVTDLRINVIAAAIMGAFAAAKDVWYLEGDEVPMSALIDDALGVLASLHEW